MTDTYTAIGLMSGTSMDGVDAAWIETDGESIVRTGPAITLPYPAFLKDKLRAVLGGQGEVEAVEREITLFHAEAAIVLMGMVDRPDIIGFHGHTILHRPEETRTWQIGDGALLSEETGVPVICDFRAADVAAGGQGAPLVPVFHKALAEGLVWPLAVLNLGGVGNITWIGEDGALLGFDTGPGNALIDDWVSRHTDRPWDDGGALARAGTVDEAALARLADHAYFQKPAPKSLDRDDFTSESLQGLSPEDGAATLTAFTALAVQKAVARLPDSPARWLVCGGGRHNPALMDALKERLTAPVEPVEAVGWDGDALEAQAFGFLAVRSFKGLPLTFPETTGASKPTTGGKRFG